MKAGMNPGMKRRMYPLLPGVAIEISAPANAAMLRGPDTNRSIDPAKHLALHPALDASVNSKLWRLSLRNLLPRLFQPGS